MANLNLVQSDQANKATRKSPKPSRRPSRVAALKRHLPAVVLGTVILVLLGLSLSHLSKGIALVTGSDMLESSAMAVGLDLLIVALEVSMVSTVGTKTYKAVARFANPAVITAFAWSGGLNALAFSVGSTMLWTTIAAAALGLTIPLLIYFGTRSWAAMAISARTA